MLPPGDDDRRQGRRRTQRRSRVLVIAVVAYAILWAVTAVAPVNRFDWLLENLLVFVLLGTMIITYRRFPLSTASYSLVTAFLALHAFGAHYTYSEVPLGFSAAKLFGLARNHYDRLVHFAFGLLFAYPARELIMRGSNLRGWPLSVAVAVLIFAVAAGYELLEWWVALLVSPSAAYAYLGTQGDVFDSQKDSSLALAGVVIGLAIIHLAVKARDR